MSTTNEDVQRPGIGEFMTPEIEKEVLVGTMAAFQAMEKGDIDMGVVEAYLYATNLLGNRDVFQVIFNEMEATWLSLYTKEQTCPIVEQTGTFVKRKLVKQYAAALVKNLTGVSGCVFVTKFNSTPEEFWTADEVVTQIADTPTKDHTDLFRTLLSQIYGISYGTLQVLLEKSVSWLELYQAVVKVFPAINLSVEVDLDGEADVATLTHAFHAYLYGGEGTENLIFV